MPTKKPTKKAKSESERQAEWVRAHPTVDSASSEYPDENARRGASRGALPNGNPWKPEASHSQPDVNWTRAVTSNEAIRETLPEDFCERTTLPDTGIVQAPPNSPRPVVVVNEVGTNADGTLAAVVGQRLAESKAFDDNPIALRVTEGIVELSGGVACEADRFEAEHLASSVRGVVRVVNRLRVQSPPVDEASAQGASILGASSTPRKK